MSCSDFHRGRASDQEDDKNLHRRRDYSRPTLTVYGRIAALTQAGTGLSSEGGGMGMGMSNAPKKRL